MARTRDAVRGCARRGKRRRGILIVMDETRELTEDEVNDLLGDDDRRAGWAEDDDYEWVR
ncbi:hypothetical protein [Streptomyces hypolithicus]